jgi:DNA polymerase-3 subunit epsilon
MREIVLDTETTGLDPEGGDRLIELGCVELMNRIPTGREYHRYFTPEGRAVHPDAEAVHGLSGSFLINQPRFADEAPTFLEFIADAPLIIHNASFDIGFINHELERLGLAQISTTRVVDTLALARRRHPAGPHSLDALCKRYGIDNSQRIKHGAIMDSLLFPRRARQPRASGRRCARPRQTAAGPAADARYPGHRAGPPPVR